MTRHPRRIHIATLFGVALFGICVRLADTPVVACDCARPGSPREELKHMDAVFSGEVIRNDREGIEFKVVKIWKGPVAKRLSIQYEISDCTYLFTVGKKYLVYAYGKDILETNRCTLNKELDKAFDDMKELGEGEEP